MGTSTPKFGLYMPAESGEPQDIVKLNENMPKIEKALGTLWINDGVVVPDVDLYDGLMVAERTSGIVWIAQKNISGTYDKKYVSYPYQFYAFAPTNNYAISGTGYNNWGWGSYYSGVEASVNSHSSELSLVDGGAWICPVKGIYDIKVTNRWQTYSIGVRASRITINGAADPNNSGTVLNAAAVDETTVVVTSKRVFLPGDKVLNQVFQNAGGPLNLDSNINVTMVNPL